MAPISEAWFYRIKAAQRDLIKIAGGIERAADITSASKSQVGRWNNATDPDIIPIAAALQLEAECGLPLITTAMAGLHGRRLTDPDDDAQRSADVLARYADFSRQAGELTSAGALALADGRLTPAEAVEVDRAASRVETTLGELRRSLAGTRAAGGFTVIQGNNDGGNAA